MLAQNFKTATDLLISDKQFEALVKVLGMLERGELKHAYAYDDDPPTFAFNMDIWDSCGTIGCIGGWAEYVGQVRLRGVMRPAALTTLFFPDDDEKGENNFDYEKITTEQAAVALRNYLTHGEARWAEAING